MRVANATRVWELEPHTGADRSTQPISGTCTIVFLTVLIVHFCKTTSQGKLTLTAH